MYKGIFTNCVCCDNILNTMYWAFFLLHVIMYGASTLCLQNFISLSSEYSYSMMPKLDGKNILCILGGNFKKIRVMMTFGSRVTQRGEGFEVQALYIENIKDNSPKSFRWGQVDRCPPPPPLFTPVRGNKPRNQEKLQKEQLF